MNYAELIDKAMKGRAVLAVAREWGINNVTLTRYVKGERMPDFDTALKMIKEAGLGTAEGFEMLAEEERSRKARNFRLVKQNGFAQIAILPLISGAGIVILSILCQIQDSDHPQLMILVLTPRSHPRRHVH